MDTISRTEGKLYRNTIQIHRVSATRPRPRRTICRQAQDWQFSNRNWKGRAAECSVWNAIAHIQASRTAPTIRMIARLCRYNDLRQVKRIIKRLERQGLLAWQHHLAVYRSNRLQYVPIELHWELLRKIEPTPASTSKPTPAKSLRSNCFKNETEKTEPLSRPVSAPAPEQQSPDPYPDTWDKPTGFDIPDRDLESIAAVIRAKGMNVDNVPRDLLAWMVQTIWLRASRAERAWKAFYGAAVYKMLNSDKAYHGALHNWEERNRVYTKWINPPEAHVGGGGDSGDGVFDKATGIFQPDLSAVMFAITHPNGQHNQALVQGLSGVRIDYNAEYGLATLSRRADA